MQPMQDNSNFIFQKGDKAFLSAYKEIKAEDLKKNLYVIASDEMEGRDTGSPGQKRAGEYMVNYYKGLGISYPKALGSIIRKFRLIL
jgi:hypothetical protein